MIFFLWHLYPELKKVHLVISTEHQRDRSILAFFLSVRSGTSLHKNQQYSAIASFQRPWDLRSIKEIFWWNSSSCLWLTLPQLGGKEGKKSRWEWRNRIFRYILHPSWWHFCRSTVKIHPSFLWELRKSPLLFLLKPSRTLYRLRFDVFVA